MGRVLVPFIALSAAVVSVGCRSKAPPPTAAALAPKPAPKPPPKPPVDAWISAKSFCALPLAKAEVPSTGGQLTDSLMTAWKVGLALKNPAQAVTLLGGRYPAIDEMRVDLSGAVMKPGKVKGSYTEVPSATSRGMTVGRFAFVAEPMVSHKANLNVQVTGADVRFDLRKDKEGKAFLLMTDAREGTLHFDASTADLERVMLAMAQQGAAGKGITVRKVELNLRSVSARSIDAELYVHTLVGFLPAGMKFTARVDVDEQMNAKIWNLTVDGDDLLGPLVTGILRPSIKKFDGKTKPLIAFPGDLKLRDVQIRAGERVTLDAVFGR
ncbi:MAG TPA: hypothetical protein VF796_23140 [Humisphaera sp.]